MRATRARPRPLLPSGVTNPSNGWTLIERDDIDVIDIAAPNNVHAEIAIAAAKAGKAILCEKPLA